MEEGFGTGDGAEQLVSRLEKREILSLGRGQYSLGTFRCRVDLGRGEVQEKGDFQRGGHGEACFGSLAHVKFAKRQNQY